MAAQRKKTRNPKTKHADVVLRFAASLRSLRQKHGLSQLQLAQRSDISVPYIGRLERAEAAPSIDLVDRLAKALHVTAAELMPATTPDPMPSLRSQAEKRFQSVMNRADRATLEMVIPWLTVLDDVLARNR